VHPEQASNGAPEPTFVLVLMAVVVSVFMVVLVAVIGRHRADVTAT
jgi:hypothetical protein